MSGQAGAERGPSATTALRSLDTSRASVKAAREELTHFVLAQAEEASLVLGFPRVGVLDAPRTFAELQFAFKRSSVTKMALPVSTKGLHHSLYLHQHATLALRFWQAVSHVQHKRSFTPVDTIELGLWMVAVGQARELSPLALALLEADLVDEVLLAAATGKRATNRRRFALDVVTFGVADAIVLEAEQRLGATVPADR